MRKKIASVLLTASLVLSATLPSYASETNKGITFPDLRTAKGTYYDYLTITTEDGNKWLLDDSANSKYIDNGTVIFQNDESVIVLFDTMGTLDYLEDDVILNVHSLEY